MFGEQRVACALHTMPATNKVLPLSVIYLVLWSVHVPAANKFPAQNVGSVLKRHTKKKIA